MFSVIFTRIEQLLVTFEVSHYSWRSEGARRCRSPSCRGFGDRVGDAGCWRAVFEMLVTGFAGRPVGSSGERNWFVMMVWFLR